MDNFDDGSFRPLENAKTFRLVGLHWRDFPSWLIRFVLVLILLTGLRLLWLAVLPERVWIAKERSADQVLEESRETFSDTEALLRAVQDNDREAVTRLAEKQKLRSARDSQRQTDAAQALRDARVRYGITATVLLGSSILLLYVERKRHLWHKRKEMDDAPL